MRKIGFKDGMRTFGGCWSIIMSHVGWSINILQKAVTIFFVPKKEVAQDESMRLKQRIK